MFQLNLLRHIKTLIGEEFLRILSKWINFRKANETRVSSVSFNPTLTPKKS